MKISKEIAALLEIIENPYLEKGYKMLKQHFNSLNRSVEVKAIDHLIQVRFDGNSRPDSTSEQ